MIRSFQRKLIVNGAALLTVGLFTGLWVAATATGKVVVAIPHMALASHLNALLGAFWLIAVAYSLDFFDYSKSQLNRMYLLILISCWGNWFITLVASFLGVRGLSYSDDLKNNMIAVLLQLVVVIPGLLGAAYWTRGLWQFSKKEL